MLRLADSTVRTPPWGAILFLSAILVVPACADGGDPIAPVPTVPAIPTVAGTVTSSATGDPVAGAEVSIGAAADTTGPDGHFELIDLSAGPATLRCVAAGFDDFEADITVPSNGITRDIVLTRVEVSTPISISATLSPQLQSVWVFGAGNAAVTVNGVPIPRGNPAGPGGEYKPPPGLDVRFYQGSLPEPVAAGLPLVLEVKANEITVQATGKVPEAPVLTAPAAGTVFTLADSITVTWTSTTDPDGFEVGFGFNSFCCAFFETPGSARELKVDASGFGFITGDNVMGIFAVNVGSFTGQADPDSHMRIQNGASPDTVITILP